ncbi:MAG: hypothetical protein AAFX03_09025 [Pseudomonadota bacterium]
MTRTLLCIAALALSACATQPAPYGPATRAGAQGYTDQAIESGRYRVGYRALSALDAQTGALRRAAELTLAEGGDWFQIVSAYSETEPGRGPSSSVSIGGGTGGRRSGVGVGVGIGFPVGGDQSGASEHVIEIVTGDGATPDDPDIYDARSVLETAIF